MAFDPERIPGVGPAIAEGLTKAGYDSIKSVAVASPSEISAETGVTSEKAKDIIEWAREEANVGGLGGRGPTFEQKSSTAKLSFGVDGVDELLDGGLETQSITEIFGSDGCGRNLIAHRLCVLAQLPIDEGGLAGSAIYIDTRNGFDPEIVSDIVQSLPDDQKTQLADRHGVSLDEIETAVLEDIHVSEAESVSEQILLAEDAKSKAESLANSTDPVRLVCVDTLTDHFKTEFQGRGEMAERQQKLNKHLHHLMRLGDLFNTAVVVTNYPGNKANDSFGGSLLSHTATFKLKMLQDSKEKRTARLVSSPTDRSGEVSFRIVRNSIKP